MKRLEGRHPPGTARMVAVSSAAVFLFSSFGCGRPNAGAPSASPVTLTIGFGLPAGTRPEIGIRQVARNLALEGLVSVGRDGRTAAKLAKGWTAAQDGLAWQIHLRPSVNFHDGSPVDAETIKTILEPQLPEALGPAFEDVEDVRTLSPSELQLTLRRASTFPMERLDDAVIQKPGTALSGTGPFAVVGQEGNEIEMRANETYYGGKPFIDRVVIKPYTSVRSAWADLLRGQLDMVYDVGVDALDSLEMSSDIRTFTFLRGYAYMVLLNTRRPQLRDPNVRRELNAAINRESLVSEVFRGHGTSADGPVWPLHWAYSADLPRFEFHPKPSVSVRLRLKCLFVDQAHERLALMVQRQLRTIGVDLEVTSISAQEGLTRLENGDFDAFLADYRAGPNLARPYLFWRSGAPNNYGGYSNKRVDAALDGIRHAADDTVYRAGVAAFQRAIVDDPPAIFLTWRERARAVSTRFVVPAEPDTDVLNIIHRWRLAGDKTSGGRN